MVAAHSAGVQVTIDAGRSNASNNGRTTSALKKFESLAHTIKHEDQEVGSGATAGFRTISDMKDLQH